MNKLVALVISTYIAFVIYGNAFFIKQLTVVKDSNQLFWNHLAIFIILMVPIYLAVSQFVSREFRGGKAFKTLLLSLAFLGLVISMFYHVIPLEPIYDLPPVVDKVFASESLFTVWLLVPIIILFI